MTGAIDELLLQFNPPARLVDVTINGPNGLMPMMVTAPDEIADYSLPLPNSGPGSYTVTWKATSHGTTYQGSFSFAVR